MDGRLVAEEAELEPLLHEQTLAEAAYSFLAASFKSLLTHHAATHAATERIRFPSP